MKIQTANIVGRWMESPEMDDYYEFNWKGLRFGGYKLLNGDIRLISSSNINLENQLAKCGIKIKDSANITRVTSMIIDVSLSHNFKFESHENNS